MMGRKQAPHRSLEDILDEPWSNPRGTENEIHRTHRALLPETHPRDLSRESTPETGSIGDDELPIGNREVPFKLQGER